MLAKLTTAAAILLSCLAIQVSGTPLLLNSENVASNVGNLADLSSSCPSGYSQPANSNWANCYKVYPNAMNKNDAESQCLRDNGMLASVPSAFVNSYIYSLTTQAGVSSIWLGLECSSGNRTDCKNDDTTKFGYNNFRSGQPDQTGNCVSMSAGNKDGQLWSTRDCTQPVPFACEVAVGANGTPSNCPPNYEMFQGMCYRLVTLHHEISANNASASCRQVPGGNLASSSSAQIQSYLVNTEVTTVTTEDPNIAFGLRCLNVTVVGDASGCTWDDGTPFEFNTFLPGYPTDRFFGCCDFNLGQWDVCPDCDMVRFNGFLCQAPPSSVYQAPSPTPKPLTSCPENYLEYEGMCYRFVTVDNPISANDASADCRSIQGGNLATCLSEQMNNFLTNMKVSVTVRDVTTAFGLRCPNIKRNGDRSSCAWDDGTPFGYNNFNAGAPYVDHGACCDFDFGYWTLCYSCTKPEFTAYYCQAPKQPILTLD